MNKDSRLGVIKALRDSNKFQVFNGVLFAKTAKNGWLPAAGRKEFDIYRDALSKIDQNMEMSDIRTIVQTLNMTVEKKYIGIGTTIYTPTQEIDVEDGAIVSKIDDGVQLGIKYKYDKTIPVVKWWEEALERAIPDEDSRMAYYEMLGLSMVTDKRMEVSYWFTGPAGTGKSTIVNSVIQGIHHTYNRSNLEPSQWRSNDPSFHTIANKLVNISSDSSNSKKLETGVFKKLASGEAVNADIKYYAPIDFENTALLVSVGNEMPVITEKTEGPFRRMIPIPMTVKVDKATKHTSIKEEILGNKDRVLEYITTKAIDAVIAVYDRDYPTMPNVAKEAIEELKDDNSSVRQWLKDKDTHRVIETYMTGTDAWGIKFSLLATQYNEWARPNGYLSIKANNIKKQVRENVEAGVIPELEIYKRNNITFLRLKKEEK